MKGCPQGSSGGISRLFTVMSIVTMDSIGLLVVVYDVKPGVVVDGCVWRLEVVDPWRSCAGGVCVFTLTARVLIVIRAVVGIMFLVVDPDIFNNIFTYCQKITVKDLRRVMVISHSCGSFMSISFRFNDVPSCFDFIC